MLVEFFNTLRRISIRSIWENSRINFRRKTRSICRNSWTYPEKVFPEEFWKEFLNIGSFFWSRKNFPNYSLTRFPTESLEEFLKKSCKYWKEYWEKFWEENWQNFLWLPGRSSETIPEEIPEGTLWGISLEILGNNPWWNFGRSSWRKLGRNSWSNLRNNSWTNSEKNCWLDPRRNSRCNLLEESLWGIPQETMKGIRLKESRMDVLEKSRSHTLGISKETLGGNAGWNHFRNLKRNSWEKFRMELLMKS